MRVKAAILVALGVVAFLSGAVGQYFFPGQPFPPSSFVFSIVGVGLIFQWFRVDAGVRGYRRSGLLDVGVIALAIIALPYYFLRSRGVLRGAAATIVMLLAAAGWGVLAYAGRLAIYFGLQR